MDYEYDFYVTSLDSLIGEILHMPEAYPILEMFLQLQKKLGDKMFLKGGAATQFYISITTQGTSIRDTRLANRLFQKATGQNRLGIGGFSPFR